MAFGVSAAAVVAMGSTIRTSKKVLETIASPVREELPPLTPPHHFVGGGEPNRRAFLTN